MASLRSITQNNPDSIVYDERTKQYHDTANRYRMVKKSVAEAMRATVSSGAPTRGDENFVSQAAFDAFRKDISKHVSETARLTKIGLEELKKSFDYQSKETERLQRAVNRTDEESQEQNKIEKISDTSESQERKRERRQNRRGMSMSSFLGLGAGGLLGAFLLASMVLTPEQHQQIGESIDESLSEITSMVDTINRINDLLRPIAELMNGSSTGGAAGPNANGAAIGQSMDNEMQFRPSTATSPPAATPTTNNGIGPTARNTLDAIRQSAGVPVETPSTPPEEPQRSQVGGGATAAASASGTLERVEENRDDPSFPHRAISSILLNNAENQRIDDMSRDPNITENILRDTIVNMLANRLQGQDVNALAEEIAARIGLSPSIHNSAEVARNIVTSINNGVGIREAARRLYETFYQRDVTGRSPIPQRSEILRNRLNRYNERQQTSVNPMGVNGAQQIAATFPIGGNNVRITTTSPIEMGAGGRQPGGRFRGTPEPLGTRSAGIQPRQPDPGLDYFARVMNGQATGSA